MQARPLKRVIYREPGEGVYLSGYERYLFTKTQAMRFVRYFNQNASRKHREDRMIFIKSANKFAYIYEGLVDYYVKGKKYMTIDGEKVLYDLGRWWDIKESTRRFRLKEKPKKVVPAPFRL